MPAIDKSATIYTLVQAAQMMHVEGVKAGQSLINVKKARTISAQDFESLADAQQVSMRTMSNVLLMLAAHFDDSDSVEFSQPTDGNNGGLKSRAKVVAKRLLRKLLD